MTGGATLRPDWLLEQRVVPQRLEIDCPVQLRLEPVVFGERLRQQVHRLLPFPELRGDARAPVGVGPEDVGGRSGLPCEQRVT